MRYQYTARDRASFWKRVQKSDGCWLWKGQPDAEYPVAFIRVVNGSRIHIRAHTAAYELFRGEIPAGLCVCHSCDTPRCARPDHLWIGTHADNMADKIAKGRGYFPGAANPARGKDNGTHTHPEKVLRGEHNGHSRLTALQVSAIRQRIQEGESRHAVATAFSVCNATVDHIINRRTWRHIA